MNNSATTRVITKIAIEYNANDKGTAKLMAENNLINDQPELQYQEMKILPTEIRMLKNGLLQVIFLLPKKSATIFRMKLLLKLRCKP